MSRLVFWVVAVVLFGVTFAYQAIQAPPAGEVAEAESMTEAERAEAASFAGMGLPSRWLQRPRGQKVDP